MSTLRTASCVLAAVAILILPASVFGDPNLPIPGVAGVVHLDLNPAGLYDSIPALGGTPAMPNPVVGGPSGVFKTGEWVAFQDPLVGGPWHWETELYNPNPNVMTFTAGWYWPGGSAAYNITLPVNNSFGLDVVFNEIPETSLNWRWRCQSWLGQPIGVDTSVVEVTSGTPGVNVIPGSTPNWVQIAYTGEEDFSYRWESYTRLLYSVDIGGDLDLSDPNNQGNEWMDCGDIYVESVPTLVKNDDGTPQSGYPMNGAPQPTPAEIGNYADTSIYSQYFDLDATDQIGREVIEPQELVYQHESCCGVHHEPDALYLSFEDDGPAGWAVSGDVPTTVPPTHGSAATRDEVILDTGLFGTWSPPTLTGIRNETALGMPLDPGTELDDDDVDALDIDMCRYHYFSVDEEANMGLDSGDIYVCDLQAAGQNRALALDDVTNLGIPDETDVDAFEFCSISPDTYEQLFGVRPDLNVNVLVALFSVDSDDLDTPGRDESGGMNPNQVYLSNLIGWCVGLAVYDEDIDAITVPEPATVVLLALGGIALMLYRRRTS